MIKVTFLGTTCMQPTKERNHSGIHVSFGANNFLFDCGEGIQRQMKLADLKITKINKIFISHWHGDHSIGLIGLLSSMGANQTSQIVEIYGPRGSKKRIELLTKVYPSMNSTKFNVHELTNSKTIIDSKDYFVHAAKLSHSVPCFAYSLQTKDKLKIDIKKANKVGLKEGPVFSKIQTGEDVKISLENGKEKTIKAKDITYLQKGKKLTYIPDTLPCGEAENIAKNSDALIIECTFLNEDKDTAIKFDHMTAKDVGMLAKKAKVKELYLTHPSTRYKNVNILKEEAKKYYPNAKDITFAKDFMTFEV